MISQVVSFSCSIQSLPNNRARRCHTCYNSVGSLLLAPSRHNSIVLSCRGRPGGDALHLRQRRRHPAHPHPLDTGGRPVCSYSRRWALLYCDTIDMCCVQWREGGAACQCSASPTRCCPRPVWGCRWARPGWAGADRTAGRSGTSPHPPRSGLSRSTSSATACANSSCSCSTNPHRSQQ